MDSSETWPSACRPKEELHKRMLISAPPGVGGGGCGGLQREDRDGVLFRWSKDDASGPEAA